MVPRVSALIHEGSWWRRCIKVGPHQSPSSHLSPLPQIPIPLESCPPPFLPGFSQPPSTSIILPSFSPMPLPSLFSSTVLHPLFPFFLPSLILFLSARPNQSPSSSLLFTPSLSVPSIPPSTIHPSIFLLYFVTGDMNGYF